MAAYDYRWKAGHDQALLDLVNVETNLSSYTNGVLLAPKTNPPDLFPNRRKLLSGRETGSGAVPHVWNFAAMPIAALDYIIDTYLLVSTVEVINAAMTIYTRRHERQGYARFNAYLHLPVPGDDYRYESGFAFDLRLRFTLLEML